MTTESERIRKLAERIAIVDAGTGIVDDINDAAEALRAYADSLERPCMDREPPHCQSCDCGAPNEPEAARVLDDRDLKRLAISFVEPSERIGCDYHFTEGGILGLLHNLIESLARTAPPPPDVQWDAERYRYMRTMNVPQFQHLFTRNVNGEGRFDDLVDAARAAEKK